MIRRVAAIPLLGLFLGATAWAASPQLGQVYPRGGQRGTTLTMALFGNRLADAKEIMFYRTGIKVLQVTVRNSRRVDFRVQIASDCPLGEHPLRLRTASGISELRTFWVGPYPTVSEKEPNNDFAKPQAVELGCTLYGRIRNEDVDYFGFSAKKGQRVSVEIEGMRLATTFFDPYIAILDTKRFELAASDDTSLYGPDGVLSVVIPKDGKYVLQVRESAFGGNNSAVYRVHLGSFPRPTIAYPLGGPMGRELEVELRGDVRGPIKHRFTTPSWENLQFGILPKDADGEAPSQLGFRLSRLDNVLEKEPNDRVQDATPFTPATHAGNGVISKPGDRDFFRFTARRGETFHCTITARSAGSPIDPVLTVHDGKTGRYLAGNDDAGRRLDSYVRFRAPANGTYVVRVTDHLGRYGPDHVYRVELYKASGFVFLSIPKVGRYGQSMMTVSVPQGNRYAAMVSVQRIDFRGDLWLAGASMPAGVRVICPKVPANSRVVPVLFEAEAKAPMAGQLTTLVANPADPRKRLYTSMFRQTAELAYGPPNRSLYHSCRINRLAMAVTRAVPFRIELVAPRAPLVRNGSLPLSVKVVRTGNFRGPVYVSMLYNPPGVGSQRNVRINGATGRLGLTANGRASVGRFPICLTAFARVGDGNVWTSSGLVDLEVTQPYATLTMRRSAVEQGKVARIVATVNHLRPFDGKATLQLRGLPPGITTPPKTIDKTTKQVVFDIPIKPRTRPARYRNVFGQLTVTVNGQAVFHRWVGRTELRVDPPRKKPTAKKPTAKPKPKAKPKPVSKKPLTRLEKLRLEQQEREAAEKRKTGGAEPSPKDQR